MCPGSLYPVSDPVSADPAPEVPARQLNRRVMGVALGLLGVLAITLGFLDYRAREREDVRTEMVAAATRGAVNLTTIDYERVDDDVQRILDSSTGVFRDDFEKRADSFKDAARKAQSKSVGTVAEAAVESVDGDQGRILVALTVMTSNRGVPEQGPRGWRTRIGVVKTDDGIKISQVEFVP